MTNYQDALKKVSKLRDKFLTTEGEGRKLAFIVYCEQVIKMSEDGVIDRREAGYVIANLMFDSTVSSTPDLESIALQAGNLELPRNVVSGDPEKEWEKLKVWVKEVREKAVK